MRAPVLVLLVSVALAGCAAPTHAPAAAPSPATPASPTPEGGPVPGAPDVPASVASPVTQKGMDAAGRLDAAHAEATFPLHVPAGASGVRYVLNWTCPQENLAPHVTLLAADGGPAGTGGVESVSGKAAPTGGFVGTTAGQVSAAPGDYVLHIGFEGGYPATDTHVFALHAEPLG
jgi:hypothetical protein